MHREPNPTLARGQSRSGVGDRRPQRDTCPLSRPAPPPPRPALSDRHAVQPFLGFLVAARQRGEPHLFAPGFVVLAVFRVAPSGCLLIHGLTVAQRRFTDG
jgi:hypothetical protein